MRLRPSPMYCGGALLTHEGVGLRTLEVDDDRAVIRDLLGKQRATILTVAAGGRTCTSGDRARRGLRRQHVVQARARATVVTSPERGARQRPGRPDQPRRACE